ncbi:hypothetical protein Hanom_Chr15g01412181 [Helianthus anomalus]
MSYWTITWLVAHPCLQAQHSPTTSLGVALANRTVYTSIEMGVCDIFELGYIKTNTADTWNVCNHIHQLEYLGTLLSLKILPKNNLQLQCHRRPNIIVPNRISGQTLWLRPNHRRHMCSDRTSDTHHLIPSNLRRWLLGTPNTVSLAQFTHSSNNRFSG